MNDDEGTQVNLKEELERIARGGFEKGPKDDEMLARSILWCMEALERLREDAGLA